MKRRSIGFIGYGNMARAIAAGLMSNNLGYELFAYDPHASNEETIALKNSANELVEASDIVFLSIKPQIAKEALQNLDFSNKIIISIMAGIDIARIESLCANSNKIVRVMPNLCARIVSATNAFTTKALNGPEIEEITSILNSFGKAFPMPEKYFDAITGLTGSSPAYTFKYILNNIKCGMDNGFDFETSKELVLYTIESSSKLLSFCNSINEIETLIDNVCSKGGTTIEGIKKLDAANFDLTVQSAVNAAINRSKELSNNIQTVNIYTDGACSGNPGKGGWAAILIYGGHEKQICGKEENTTNNRMELKAVIEALKQLKTTCNVNVYSDSDYVVKAIREKWIENWIKRDWANVKNTDLWKELLEQLSKHNTVFNKVKGHSDDFYNFLCDKLAVSQTKE